MSEITYSPHSSCSRFAAISSSAAGSSIGERDPSSSKYLYLRLSRSFLNLHNIHLFQGFLEVVFILQFFKVVKNPLATACSKVKIFLQGNGFLPFSDSKNGLLSLNCFSVNLWVSSGSPFLLVFPLIFPFGLYFFFYLYVSYFWIFQK